MNINNYIKVPRRCPRPDKPDAAICTNGSNQRRDDLGGVRTTGHIKMDQPIGSERSDEDRGRGSLTMSRPRHRVAVDRSPADVDDLRYRRRRYDAQCTEMHRDEAGAPGDVRICRITAVWQGNARHGGEDMLRSSLADHRSEDGDADFNKVGEKCFK